MRPNHTPAAIAKAPHKTSTREKAHAKILLDGANKALAAMIKVALADEGEDVRNGDRSDDNGGDDGGD